MPSTVYQRDSPPTAVIERCYLAGHFIIAVGYGLELALWFLCTSYLWGRRRRSYKILFLLTFLALLLVAETVFAITQGHLAQSLYIEHRDFDGGPWQYYLATQTIPATFVYHASLFVLTFLGDFLVLWRCWVIWSAFERKIAIIVTSFPASVLVASFVVGAVWIAQSSRGGEPLVSKTVYYTVSMVLNVALTSLIVLRLLMFRRAHLSLLPEDHARQYLSLAAIVIESAAIHTAFALAFVVAYALDAPSALILIAFTSTSQQVGAYLILFRVADGKACSRNTLQVQL